MAIRTTRTKPERRMLDAYEVAALIGVSPETVWRGVRRGDFPIEARRVGGVLRFSAREVMTFCDGAPPSRTGETKTARASSAQ